MGRTFRDSSFIGVDIGQYHAIVYHCCSYRITVPIATRYPLGNTRFEIQDISEQLRWSDGTFDLIHARDLSMGVGGMFRFPSCRQA